MGFAVEFRGVSFGYMAKTVLDDVSLTIAPGEVFIFGGRSGAGKSALLEICVGLLKPSRGAVLWNGEDITGMSKYELYGRRKSVGYVFQTHALIANHSVFDNIALPLKCGGNLNSREIRGKVESLMDELKISRDIEKKFPEMLSAAQLRSVAIARALVNEPNFLLLDEPLSGVDPLTADCILNVLHEKWKKCGMSIIMAAHSLSAWPEWSAKRFMLKDGCLEPASEAFGAVRNVKYHQRYSYAK
jgi:ABC-type methionine transport system ATPase subunit